VGEFGVIRYISPNYKRLRLLGDERGEIWKRRNLTTDTCGWKQMKRGEISWF
jgi:hypothetical protein